MISPPRLALLDLRRRPATTLIALVALAMPLATLALLTEARTRSGARLARLERGDFAAVAGGKTSSLALILGALGGEGEAPPPPLTYNLVGSLRDLGASGERPAGRAFLRHLVPLTVWGQWQGHKVIGTDAAFWQRPAPLAAGPELVAGRPPTAADEVAISDAVLRTQGSKLGDVLTVSPWVSRRPEVNSNLPVRSLRVVGIFKGRGRAFDDVLWSDVSAAFRALADLAPTGELHPVWKERVVHYLLLAPQPGGMAPMDELINGATIAQMIDVEAELTAVARLQQGSVRLGWAISLGIMLLGALAILGTELARGDSRQQNLAALRALGYRPAELALLLATEGLVLGGGASLAALGACTCAWPHLADWLQLASPGESFAAPLAGIWRLWPLWLAAPTLAAAASMTSLARLYGRDAHQALRSA